MAVVSEVFSAPAKDGVLLRFRLLVPSDRQQIIDGYHELSDRSRYARFHALYDELTDDQLAFLNQLDGQSNVAWGAFVDEPGCTEPRGVGMGRYAMYLRETDEPPVADVALTVLDEWHGRGVGTALLKALVLTAHAAGIEAFETVVLAENDAMLSVFRRYGGEVGPVEHGVVEVRVKLAPLAGQLTDHPLAKLFALAAGIEEERPAP